MLGTSTHGESDPSMPASAQPRQPLTHEPSPRDSPASPSLPSLCAPWVPIASAATLCLWQMDGTLYELTTARARPPARPPACLSPQCSRRLRPRRSDPAGGAGADFPSRVCGVPLQEHPEMP